MDRCNHKGQQVERRTITGARSENDRPASLFVTFPPLFRAASQIGRWIMMQIATRRAVLRRLAVFLMALPITSCATPMSLHEAVARGNVSRIDMCMKRGMSVNAQDDQGNTPLHHAHYQGRQDIVD